MKFRLFLVISLFFLSNASLAESGCPDGFSPNQIQGQQAPSCYPIPGYNNQVQEQPQISQGHWETRWGAIAVGSTMGGGGVGVVINSKDKKTAEISALSQCHINGGGSECRIEISYYNQCAVVAWGDNYYSTASSATIERASKIALKTCKSKTQNCKIYYADCTDAVWIN